MNELTEILEDQEVACPGKCLLQTKKHARRVCANQKNTSRYYLYNVMATLIKDQTLREEQLKENLKLHPK